MSKYLPSGCRFIPTEEELLTYYLKNIAMGQLQLPCSGVTIRNLYDDAPWRVLKDNDPWDMVVDTSGKIHARKKVIYVITILSYVDKNTNLYPAEDRKNMVRKAGCGTWHADTAKQDVYNSQDKIIGKKRTLSFESDSEMVGRWTMQEYTLAGVSLDGLASNEYALCRITKRDVSKSFDGKSVVKEFEGIGNKRKAVQIEEAKQCENYKVCKRGDSVEEVSIMQLGPTSASSLTSLEIENTFDNVAIMNCSMMDNGQVMMDGKNNTDMFGAFEQFTVSGMVNDLGMDERNQKESTNNFYGSSFEDAPEWKQWLELDTLEWPGLFDNASYEDQGVLFHDAVDPSAFKGDKEGNSTPPLFVGSAGLEHAADGMLDAKCGSYMDFFDYDRYEREFDTMHSKESSH